MASCHSLTLIEGQLTGDPLDLKMFEATNFIFEEPNVEDTNKFDMITPTVVRPAEISQKCTNENSDLIENDALPFEVGIIRELPFSSSLQVGAQLIAYSIYPLSPVHILKVCKFAEQMSLYRFTKPNYFTANVGHNSSTRSEKLHCLYKRCPGNYCWNVCFRIDSQWLSEDVIYLHWERIQSPSSRLQNPQRKLC